MLNLKTLFVAALSLGFIGTASAQTAPQPYPTTPREAKAYVQNLPGSAWQRMTAASLGLKFLVGKPIVAVFNPYDEEIQNVVCDGKWSLVGPNAYNKKKGAPDSIAPHQVAFIPTDDFDNY